MAWDKGFNFRRTDTFVTDGADETYVRGGDTYPVTRNGVTFGWEDALVATTNDRDRSDANDRRLAGIVFVATGASLSEYRFRVDLPATGNYDVRLAIGDQGTTGRKFGELRDNTTALKAYSDAAVGSNHYDVEENAYSTANWPGSNAAHEYAFATQICRFALKRSAEGFTVIEHLSLSQVEEEQTFQAAWARGSNILVSPGVL